MIILNYKKIMIILIFIYDHFLKCERLCLASLWKGSFLRICEKKKNNDIEGSGVSI
jgi:hypothetical protein